MGTNYYLHLGKRISEGPGKTAFLEAVDLWLHQETGNLTVFGGSTVQDEYGDEITFREFIELVKDDRMDAEAIGRQFS